MDNVKLYPDIYRLSRVAAEFFVTQAKRAINERGQFLVVLSGGGTPESLYSLLTTDAYSPRVEWDKVHVFWGDERCVPPDHIESNYRMVKNTLLDQVPLPPENVHRIQGEQRPEAAARYYENDLRQFFGEAEEYPRFDVVFLGLGTDGHTASLFPHTEALRVQERWVDANYVEEMKTWRITLTVPVINAAAYVVFLVTGLAKAERVKETLLGDYQPDALPAQLIKPANGELIWLMDEEAGSLLPR